MTKQSFSNPKKNFGYHYGYYEDQPNRPDTLYVVKIKPKKGKNQFFKVGRTFHKKIYKRFSRYNIHLIKTYKTWGGSHQIVYNIEQRVIKAFKQHSRRHPPRHNINIFGGIDIAEI